VPPKEELSEQSVGSNRVAQFVSVFSQESGKPNVPHAFMPQSSLWSFRNIIMSDGDDRRGELRGGTCGWSAYRQFILSSIVTILSTSHFGSCAWRALVVKGFIKRLIYQDLSKHCKRLANRWD
jgi:hypothetical protein